MFATLLALSCSAVLVEELAAPVNLTSKTIIGYYSWNYGAGSEGPKGANAGAAFPGYADVDKAITGYTKAFGGTACCPELKGTKYLTLGGDNGYDDKGTFTDTILKKIAKKSSSESIKKAGYGGVMFDIEVVKGSESVMVAAFELAFKNLKANGLIVGITTSHSAPTKTDTPEIAIALVKSWVKDTNVDIISPQLYTSGKETAPDFSETWECKSAGCTWDLYKGLHAKFVPSIVDETQYNAAMTYFKTSYGIKSGGYFVWKQETTNTQIRSIHLE